MKLSLLLILMGGFETYHLTQSKLNSTSTVSFRLKSNQSHPIPNL